MSQAGAGVNEDVTMRLEKCVPLEIQYGGNSLGNNIIVFGHNEVRGVLHTGDLVLKTGMIVRGRVTDAEGNGMSNVKLTTSGPHGPHSGRTAMSGEDGAFEFAAMEAGNLTVHADARLRDVSNPPHQQVVSRDVQAVFADQHFTIPEVATPHEITVQAVPHTEVTFEWIDRRADSTQPVSYYGCFRVRGYMPDGNGKPATYWTGETVLTKRHGKPLLVVKVPSELLKPELMVVADRKVTASYSDSSGATSGPGVVPLGDLRDMVTRIIYGDEPRVRGR